MDLRTRIHQRFRQLGKSYFRTTLEDAELLAGAVSSTHAQLGAFCQFCLAPTACSATLSLSIVTKWLDSMPQVLEWAPVVAQKPVEAAKVVGLGDTLLSDISNSARAAGIEYGSMNSAEAAEFGNCIRRAASPSFAFFQRCMSPERHTLAVLAACVKAYLEGAVTYGAAAGLLLQAARERAP